MTIHVHSNHSSERTGNLNTMYMIVNIKLTVCEGASAGGRSNSAFSGENQQVELREPVQCRVLIRFVLDTVLQRSGRVGH